MIIQQLESHSTFIAKPEGIMFFGHSNSVVWKRQPDSSSSTYFSSGLCIKQTDVSIYQLMWLINQKQEWLKTRKLFTIIVTFCSAPFAYLNEVSDSGSYQAL